MSGQEREQNIEGVTSQTMLEYLPCSDKTRSKLLELMNSHKGHIFTDLSVHMLMVCLLLFDSQDDDSSIRWGSAILYVQWWPSANVPGAFTIPMLTCCGDTWRCTALNPSGISKRFPSSVFYQLPFPNHQIQFKVLNCVKALPSISNARNKLMLDMYAANVQPKKPRLTEILERNW